MLATGAQKRTLLFGTDQSPISMPIFNARICRCTGAPALPRLLRPIWPPSPQGLCLCEKGYWGIDCAVRWEGSGDSRRAVVDVNYDISRYSLVPKGVRGAAGADAGDAERDAFDPRSPTFYVVDQPPQFRSQPNFWEHGDWWPYVLSDPRRVGDPREANYFFFTQSMVSVICE